jgi:hypothetical protein
LKNKNKTFKSFQFNKDKKNDENFILKSIKNEPTIISNNLQIKNFQINEEINHELKIKGNCLFFYNII